MRSCRLRLPLEFYKHLDFDLPQVLHQQGSLIPQTSIYVTPTLYIYIGLEDVLSC